MGSVRGTTIVVNSDTNLSGRDVENISDIQNYLQSFNKEIGETTVSATEPNSITSQTYYTIDTSQVIAAQNASDTENGGTAQEVPVTTSASADGESSSYQTLAIVPDAVSGGYVLIVQPTSGSNQTQVSIPVSGTPIVAGSTIALARNASSPEDSEGVTVATIASNSAENEAHIKDVEMGEDNLPLTKIKQERIENEKPNDISVYDFDEVNPPVAGAIEEEEPEGMCENEQDEMHQIEPGDVKPILSTPKQSTKRTKKSPGLSGKKHKISTPATPAGSNQHVCNYCSYTSNKRYLLSRHMKSHSEERPHKCGICERGFKTLASLQNHVNTHTGVRPHGCKYCDAAFTTSGELVRHVRYRHTHEKPHRCTECDYASVELSKLKRHMRCHTGERPYQCPHCTYASPDTYKLKRHLRIHTGEKPYECDVCHARFTQSNSLKAHRLIHSGNKPVFKCDQCPTTCGRKTDLRIHVQKLHTSDKPLTCKRCDQSFPDRYSFKIHLKSHEGEKCFKCDLCNYASVSARHLESHMLIHTDQKPFECDECEQSFRQKQLLKRHKNLYHNPEYIPPQPKEKTHECPHCTKAFRHKGNLMRHLVVHDPDAYKDSSYDQNNRANDSHQLIDEESDENSQMILPNIDEESLDPQALQFTLDPQTQQMISGEQVVVFEVVQLNSGEENDSQNSYAAIEQTGPSPTIILDQSTLTNKKPRTAILATGGSKATYRTATLRNASVIASTNGTSSKENIIIQLQAEDEEAANIIQNDDIIDDPDYTPSGKSMKLATTIPITSPSQSSNIVVPPPIVISEDTKLIRDQIQKQKDLAECFGFKDDDEEDEAILSMPAAHAQ